jgi:hypothetical protein
VNASGVITPGDVFQLVTVMSAEIRWLTGAMTVVGVLIVLQIGAKVILFGRILSVLDKVIQHQARTEKLLDMAEVHGRVTDNQKERTTQVLHDTQRTLGELADKTAKIGVRAATAAAERLATVVAEQITKASGTGSASEAEKLATVKPAVLPGETPPPATA